MPFSRILRIIQFMVLSFLLSPIIISSNLLAQEPKSDWEKPAGEWGKNKTEPFDYNQICDIAQKDAGIDEGSGLGYGAGGFLCGCFGWLYVEIKSAKPPSARLIGKDMNYVLAYKSCYEKKAKSIRRTAACTGWAISSALSILLFPPWGY